MSKIESLLTSSILSEDTKSVVTEAWNEAVKTARKDAEQTATKELSERYNADLQKLVEASEKFVADTLEEEKAKLAEHVSSEISALKEKHAKQEEYSAQKLAEALEEREAEQAKLVEARLELATLKKQLQENANKQEVELDAAAKTLIEEALNEEVRNLELEKAALIAERANFATQLKEAKTMLREEFDNRVKKIEEFAVAQIAEEISELQEDANILAEERVKLHTEAEAKFEEVKAAFIAEQTAKADAFIAERVEAELTEFKEDIRVARENDFGRHIFEAFAAEYMTSYFMEDSKLSELQSRISVLESELHTSKEKLSENEKAKATSAKRLAEAEQAALHAKKVNELTNALPSEERKTMVGLLESVKYNNLENTFNRFLPKVVNSSVETSIEAKPLTEEAKASVAGKTSFIKESTEFSKVENKRSTGDLELCVLAGVVNNK